MAEFYLSYNPFTVETSLSVKVNGKWVPISEESGLLRISKMRMQRWLDPSSGYYYFDDLREAAGEDDIDIYFSGTAEDMDDLKKAADEYSRSKKEVNIRIQEMGNVKENSSKAKLKILKKILLEVNMRLPDYKILFPDYVWEYLMNSVKSPSLEAILIPFIEWESRKKEIFSIKVWKMVCFSLPYEYLHDKEMKKMLRSFSKELENISDRRFERERFLFICHSETKIRYVDNDVKRIFMEYGLQDMNVVTLSNKEFEDLDNLEYDGQSESLKQVQRSILVFNERYAEQYRLRKIHDVFQKMCYANGYIQGPKLLKKIDSILRENQESSKRITDKTVKEAYDWLSGFLDSIDHLLDVDMIN